MINHKNPPILEQTILKIQYHMNKKLDLNVMIFMIHRCIIRTILLLIHQYPIGCSHDIQI
jgi:hypothetical protein